MKKLIEKKTKKTPANLRLIGVALEDIKLGHPVMIQIDTKAKITTVELMRNLPDTLNLKAKDLKK